MKYLAVEQSLTVGRRLVELYRAGSAAKQGE